MEKTIFDLYFTKNKVLKAEIDKNSRMMIHFIVQSYDFSGKGPIYLNAEKQRKAIVTLQNMIESLSGELVLYDEESEKYYIQIYFFNGELKVKGVLGDYSDNQISFCFFADQTVLTLLMQVLEELIR